MSRELLKQALYALKYHSIQTRPIDLTNETIEALRQELAKPESINHAAWHWHNLYQAKCQEFHDKQTTLGTEIVALEEELAELKEEQLAKPEQEPVAWVKSTASGYNVVGYESNVINKLSNETPLYTAPPRKEWVGLTSIEVRQLKDIHIPMYSIPILDDYLNFYRAIEKEIKDKNTT